MQRMRGTSYDFDEPVCDVFCSLTIEGWYWRGKVISCKATESLKERYSSKKSQTIVENHMSIAIRELFPLTSAAVHAVVRMKAS